METFNLSDWLGAAGGYTPAVNLTLQWLKQSAHWRNRWCVWAAPVIGLLLAVFGLIAADKLQLVDGALYVDRALTYKEAVQGIFAGILALVGYDLQKQLPFRLLKAGPDNHPADQPKVEGVTQ